MPHIPIDARDDSTVFAKHVVVTVDYAFSISPEFTPTDVAVVINDIIKHSADSIKTPCDIYVNKTKRHSNKK